MVGGFGVSGRSVHRLEGELYVYLLFFVLALIEVIEILVFGKVVEQDPVKFKTSHFNIGGRPIIVVYILQGWDHELHPDLRGLTWEKDFELGSDVKVYQVSNGPLYKNGINFTFLPEGQKEPYVDYPNHLIGTEESWKHFRKYHSDARWFLRGMYDMYVNVTNLRRLLMVLEAQYDPFEEWVARFGCGYGGVDFPHGTTGHLLSNFAVDLVWTDIEFFRKCRVHEDVCLRRVLDRKNISLYPSCSNQFVVALPPPGHDGGQQIECPKWNFYYPSSLLKVKPCVVSEAVTIHMHGSPMNEWKKRISDALELSVCFWRPGIHVYRGKIAFCVDLET